MTATFKTLFWHNTNSRIPLEGEQITFVAVDKPHQQDGVYRSGEWVPESGKRKYTTQEIVQWRQQAIIV